MRALVGDQEPSQANVDTVASIFYFAVLPYNFSRRRNESKELQVKKAPEAPEQWVRNHTRMQFHRVSAIMYSIPLQYRGSVSRDIGKTSGKRGSGRYYILAISMFVAFILHGIKPICTR